MSDIKLPYIQYMTYDKDFRLVAFADDLTCADSVIKIRSWWTKLFEIDPKYDYFPKSTNTILIVKLTTEDNAK